MSHPLQVLRDKLASERATYLIVPSVDEHNSEYTPPQFARLKFITGFTGSAGTALICASGINYFWTDGRYWTQAEAELNKEEWQLMKSRHPGVPTIYEFIAQNIEPGGLVAANPVNMNTNEVKTAETAFQAKAVNWLWTWKDWIDEVWKRDMRMNNEIFLLNDKYSGKSCDEKLNEIYCQMRANGAKYLILTSLDEIAWVLNLRGTDIPYNPIFYAFLIIKNRQVDPELSNELGNDDSCVLLFVNPEKITTSVGSYLQKMNVCIKDYNQFYGFISTLSSPVWIDPMSNYGIHLLLNEKFLQTIVRTSPIAHMKSIKNAIELQGMIDAHLEDSIALIEFFFWLEKNVYSPDSSALTEYHLAQKVTEFRSKKKNFFSISFETISSVGPNAAIIHYTPNPNGSSPLTPDQIYLLDSGAHYLNGTTDVTRTWHFDTPKEREKLCYTKVLQGFLELSNVNFPIGVAGCALDILARIPLWDVGLDYQHGTGHGIGHFLCVHELPPSISLWRSSNQSHFPLQENMCFTIEPGYYEPDSFGIRIENAVYVSKSSDPNFLRLEHLTMVPINKKLIIKDLLSQRQIQYLNEYHKKVYDVIGPRLEPQIREWLKTLTDPL